MKIELRKLSDIKPYPQNPRVNDDAVDAVAASIREFGVRQPIVVDTEGVIIVEHTRWKAAQKLGLEKVPVHVAKESDASADQGVPDRRQPDQYAGRMGRKASAARTARPRSARL
jgi:ParB-like chromosome segregation protein Spo0J